MISQLFTVIAFNIVFFVRLNKFSENKIKFQLARAGAGQLGAAGRLGQPWPIEILKFFTILAENLRFWRKSRISVKISDFGENLGFWRKSRILAKISDFGENLGLRRKSWTSAKISVAYFRVFLFSPNGTQESAT